VADHLVDTNVLIVGSAAVEPRYTDVNVDQDGIERVLDWLIEFRDDDGRQIVLDELWKIWKEYKNKLNDQHFGLQVINHKLKNCLRTVPVEYDGDGHAVVPSALAAVDNSDKKFVAAALVDPANIHIVNAADGDWRQHVDALSAHGVVVLELLP
jgi:hypothetical protein